MVTKKDTQKHACSSLTSEIGRQRRKTQRKRRLKKTLKEALAAAAVGTLMAAALLYAIIADPASDYPYQEPVVMVSEDHGIPVSRYMQFAEEQAADREAQVMGAWIGEGR